VVLQLEVGVFIAINVEKNSQRKNKASVSGLVEEIHHLILLKVFEGDN